MTYPEKRVILEKRDGWIKCPRCAKKIFKPLTDTEGKNIPVVCYDCKITWVITIKPEP